MGNIFGFVILFQTLGATLLFDIGQSFEKADLGFLLYHAFVISLKRLLTFILFLLLKSTLNHILFIYTH
jgi:hypothetical protein